VKYKLLSEEDVSRLLETETVTEYNKIIKSKEYIKGITIDISGGGLQFTSDRAHSKGEYVIIEFPIIVQGKIKNLSILSEIVLTEKLPNRVGIYEHRISYVNISNKDREDLIKYIFEEERRYRKNEKG
ncbi:MAG: PilZ domain-containing protein, partial [Clostridiales bacterium]|nr:PilZ domain-containing protein [Clostridiales bacterium]